jgi:hypothetical protein
MNIAGLACRIVATIALVTLPHAGLTQEESMDMTRPTLTLTAPDSILVGEAFKTTITATNSSDIVIQTVPPDSGGRLVHRLEPVGALPVRHLFLDVVEDELEEDEDEDGGGPPGAEDDESEEIEDSTDEEDAFYYVLSGRQKRDALSPDDRVNLPPAEMVDLEPGAVQHYVASPNDHMIEPIPAGHYNLTGILIGPDVALETLAHPLEIRRLNARALTACTHISGTAQLVTYAHQNADGDVTIYQHVTGPGAKAGPGYVRGQAVRVESLAQTCGDEEMLIGPSWVAWTEDGTFRATIAARGTAYGTVETQLNLPGATLAPLGWQDGNDGLFFALGDGGQAALVSVSLDGDGVPLLKRLALDLAGEVLGWEVNRTSDGEIHLITALATKVQTRVIMIVIDPTFSVITQQRQLLETQLPFARLSIERLGSDVNRVHVLSHQVSDQLDPNVILTSITLSQKDATTEIVLSTTAQPEALYLVSDSSNVGVRILARSGTSLHSLNTTPATLLTRNLSSAAPAIIAITSQDRAFALVADPDWGLTFLDIP